MYMHLYKYVGGLVGGAICNICCNYSKYEPVPVAARSVYGRSPAEIVGSNPTGVMDGLSVVSVVCCQVEVSATG